MSQETESFDFGFITHLEEYLKGLSFQELKIIYTVMIMAKLGDSDRERMINIIQEELTRRNLDSLNKEQKEK